LCRVIACIIFKGQRFLLLYDLPAIVFYLLLELTRVYISESVFRMIDIGSFKYFRKKNTR